MNQIILKVREIFYSIQGEGRKAGTPAIFIRLAKCNLNCWFCDTDWTYGKNKDLNQIVDEVMALLPNPKIIGQWIIWTGGEPTLQLSPKVVDFFTKLGFNQAIETNGTNPVPFGIDYIAVSPKKESPPDVLNANFPDGVDEIRYPCRKGDAPPPIIDLPAADHYYISPVFEGKPHKRMQVSKRNVRYCVDFVKNNQGWELSAQNHKLLGVE